MSDALARIRAILTTTPLRWSQMVETIPEELLRLCPAPSEWSALECLEHIIDTEQIFPVRLEALRHERDIPAFDPEQQGTQGTSSQSIAELLATFIRLRAASLLAVATVRSDMLDHSGIHSEFGRVTLGELMHEWAAHDLDHTIQAERAMMQPFIQGCGPWQPYFAANRIAE